MKPRKLPIIGTDQFALVDDDYDGEWLSTFKWYLNPNGYVYRPGFRPPRSSHQLSRVAYGESLIPPKAMVFFKDGNRLNCQTSNLQLHLYAGTNLPPGPYKVRSDNKLGYRGVRKTKEGRYIVRFFNQYAGTYKTVEEACAVYNELAHERWGDRAPQNNFPPLDLSKVEYV